MLIIIQNALLFEGMSWLYIKGI